ncbi:MAG: hypothetical protein KF681_01270 [Bdellovibrionaceae bacterium]|nr:hypothetical protein [Pseudobdellovibrionaceae bacterium]
MELSKMVRSSRPGVNDLQKEPLAEDEISVFFNKFNEAMTSGDGEAMAALWAVPALVMSDDMVRAVRTSESVSAFFANSNEQYNERGIVGSRPEVQHLDWLTDKIVMVEVRWPYLDQDGHERGSESSTYTLRRDDAGDFKVQAVVMHGEIEATSH